MNSCLPNCVQVKMDIDVENGNEIGQSTEDCLRNPVIVRKILHNFSSPELLKLSLVNKLWKYEARSVLVERGHFIAHVKSNDSHRRPTGKIEAFISDLKEMNLVPYSGISLNIDFDRVDHAPAVGDPDPLQGVILVKPWLKKVSVTLRGSWPENLTCSAALLTKKLLQDCNGFLGELELIFRSGREHFMKHVVQDITFPRLKILKLRDCWESDVAYEEHIKVFLSRAPNLKVLLSNWSINSMLRILEGSSIQPVFGFAKAPFEGISENVFSGIQLESIILEYTGPEFNLERFNRVTPSLLQQSCTTTLRSVRLDAVLAIPLMTYGMRLENVKDLYMEIGFYHLQDVEPRILRIVKNFNYSRIFPNVSKVSIESQSMNVHNSQDHMNAIIDRANAILREPMPDRAARVKELVLHYFYPSRVAAEFYLEMFPSIEKLEMSTPLNQEIPFGSIWNWLELREFYVKGDLLATNGNLDSVFCGIFPEEVAELRLKDDEYLKEVNIVPVMPAITCLKNLRTLSLHHDHSLRDLFGGDDATFVFSKVAALIAFARPPALEVTLIIYARSAPPGLQLVVDFYDRQQNIQVWTSKKQA